MTQHIAQRANEYRREQRDAQRGISFIVSLLIVAGLMVAARGRLEVVLGAPTAQQPTSSSSTAKAEQEVRTLEAGAAIERELAGGEVHFYRIALTTGEYLRMMVDQRGIDVAMVLRGPDGAQLTEMDGLSGMLSTEEVSWEAGISGEYRLEVRARAKEANKGRYEVQVEKAQSASEKDRARVAAERLYMEGRRAETEGKGVGLERAIKKYEEAVEKWREAGVRKWKGLTLNNLGIIYANLSQFVKAREYYEQALKVRREIMDRGGEGATLNNLGNVYRNLNQYEQARNCLQQALVIMREIKDRRGEGATLNSLGSVYMVLSQYEQARENYEQALMIRREIKDRANEGSTLNNLGNIYLVLGPLEKARDYYEQALAIKRETGDRRGEGSALSNLGNIYRNMSQYEKAHDYLEQALVITREFKNKGGEATTLIKLGLVYRDLGRYDQASEYFEQALMISRETKDRRGEREALMGLGTVYGNMSQYEKARDYLEQALAIGREIKDRQGEGGALINLGIVYEKLNQYHKTREYLEQALAIKREIKDREEGLALIGLGNFYRNLNQYVEARNYYEQALTITREVKDRRGEVVTLHEIARLELGLGNPTAARLQIEDALSIIESLRTTVSSQELRSSFFASVQDFYEFHIDLLMQLHKLHPAAKHDAAALEASERARARSLLELLAEARADIRQGVDPQLLARSQEVQRALSKQSGDQTRLLSTKHTPEQAAAIAQQINRLVAEYDDVQAQIRRNSPRYAALTQPQPLNLREIQQLLDPDTLLLEYALGKERSYVWAVTSTSLKSYVLPKRADIETAARRLLELLTARAQSVPNETLPQRSTRLKQAEHDFQQAAATLSQMLLSPLASELKEKRLLIASDGALQYVPFAALPDPAAQTASGSQPLIVKHEIVSVPSVSSLAVLRRETSGRKPHSKAVAVLADPVFDANDARLSAVAQRVEARGDGATARSEAQTATDSAPQPRYELVRSAGDVGVLEAGRLPRLPFSRDEAKAIASVTRASDRLQALDFQANRQTATSTDLMQYRIIHFATHGLLNSQHPELSGIVLSLVDEQGQPQNGFLRLHDIYNLQLPADLVVLSACQTALGKEIRGEGLVGLTRGFMYAGAKRVMASLWQVEDEATAELMKRFYAGMLRQNMTPAAALRSAQQSLRQQKRWQSPFYWSGFVLQGDWQR